MKNKKEVKTINTEPLKELGQGEINKNPRGNIQCISIIGEIEGHSILSAQSKTTKYEHIIPMLVSMYTDEEVDGILIILNTVGGDVEAGLAIAEMLSSIRKPVVSLVLGGGHSIGVPLALSASYSFIAPTASMTVHPIRMSGTIIGGPQTYEYFEKMQDRINQFIINNSEIKIEKLKKLIYNTKEMAKDVGTVVVGKEAVKLGLINEVGGLDASMEKLFELIDKQRKKRKKQKSK